MMAIFLILRHLSRKVIVEKSEVKGTILLMTYPDTVIGYLSNWNISWTCSRSKGALAPDSIAMGMVSSLDVPTTWFLIS